MKANLSRLNPGQAQVMSMLKRRPKSGLTRRELEVICNRTRGTICARVGELLEKKLVVRDGRRFDVMTKKNVQVIRVAQ